MHIEIRELIERATVAHLSGESLTTLDLDLREVCFNRHPELTGEFDATWQQIQALHWGDAADLADPAV
jgi:hypothetical protein